MSGRNLNRFNRYRTRDRAREKVLTREEIMRECFSDENEAPMVFPMGHSATAYAGEVLATSKGVLEVTTQGESWIPEEYEGKLDVPRGTAVCIDEIPLRMLTDHLPNRRVRERFGEDVEEETLYHLGGDGACSLGNIGMHIVGSLDDIGKEDEELEF